MENKTSEKLTAYLYAGTAPSEEQKKRFEAFLKNKYDREISLEWKEDKDIKGFKLVYDREIYNWTPEGRFAQLKDKLSELSLRYASKSQPDQMITLLKKSIEDFELEAVAEEEGKVKTVGDGIVVVEGKVNLRALPLKPSLRYDLLRLLHESVPPSFAQSYASASNPFIGSVSRYP